MAYSKKKNQNKAQLKLNIGYQLIEEAESIH